MLTHKGTQTLQTERLILRWLTENDAEAMFQNWATDEKTVEFLTWDAYEEIDKLKEFIAKCVLDYENIECYHWVIEFDGTIVGTINLHDIQTKKERCELGYCIGSKWWSKGIVTEAAKAVIAFAFTELNASKICAYHDTKNPASGRVMQKCGMKQEGLLREHSIHRDGTRSDLVVYGILKHEWREANGIQ
jgi:ribosomal-protein-alanine N-acetyltransferase